MPQLPVFEPGSFRDRSGRVFSCDGRIYRALSRDACAIWEKVANSEVVKSGVQAGTIIATERSPDVSGFVQRSGFHAAFAHPRIPLITWPYEWSFSMLRAAAALTLSLMQQCLQEDLILKDASAFNIQFRGTKPVLIDVGSIVPLKPGQVWEGYRQFCQMFLFPLMLQSWKGIDFQPWLRGSIEGISPEQFSSLLSFRDLFRRGAITHGWLHARLQAPRTNQTSVAKSMQDHGFSKVMIQNNILGLQRLVESLQWRPATSTWSDYDVSSEPVLRDASQKESFVAEVCATQHWKTIWDLGCNQGRYSRLAAAHADSVLAVDSDHLTVDRLYNALKNERFTSIVPMVGDLADPSPSLGWRGEERQSLVQRSQPDLVICLALIHHLVISRNLLLVDVVDWLASLKSAIIIEFVSKDDAQVQQLLRHREDVFTDYSLDVFRSAISRAFDVDREITLPSGSRRLFFLRPRQ